MSVNLQFKCMTIQNRNKEYDAFRALKILHLLILMGLLVFAFIAVLIDTKNFLAISDESVSRILQVVSILFSFTMLILGYNWFKKRIISARTEYKSAKTRMNKYRMACINWWMMIQMPGIFAIIGYILTSNLSFFILALLHGLVLFLFSPRKENIIILLNLTPKEISELGH